ncbi:MAG: hypothetical protein R3B06_25040 [Kofleriaceae bacterium]
MRLVRLLTTCTVLAALAAPALAAPYEAFIDVETQEDLDDLLASGEISSDTYDALTELLGRGVDLDRATREDLYALPNLTYGEVDAILAYRELQRFVANPIDLVAAGALSEQKLLAISAFLVVGDRSRGEYAPRGWVRANLRAAQGDDRPPPVGVRARVMLGRRITVGAAATDTRLRLGQVAWDPNRDGLVVDDVHTSLHVPKLFARYRGDTVDVIAGTYRVGFGERLTFDNSNDYTPDGIYFDDQLHYTPDLALACRESTGELAGSPCSGAFDYVTPDNKWSDGLTGVAAGSSHISVGGGYLQAYGWGSYQPKSLYQYQLLDRAACADPYDATDPACAAPPVFVRPTGGDALAPAAAASYQTLPNMYAESLVGGHLAFHAARRDYVGVTAYGATTRWLAAVPPDVRLDFQDWARTPIGGRYGAIGVNASLGRGIYDATVEVTRSFDRSPDRTGAIDGGGGFGAIARFTRSVRKRELELSARYYDANFDNPYAGPIAADDIVDGVRARGEHGVRARYTGVHGVATIRASLDLWRAYVPELDGYLARIDTYAHLDVQGSDQLRYGLWLDFADKDLGQNGLGECYSILVEDNQLAKQYACRGMRLKTTARVRYQPARRLSLFGQVQHAWLDDARYDSKRRSDLSATVEATWRQADDLRLKARARYLFQDVSDNTYLEQSIWVYGEAVKRLREKDALTVRLDLFTWLDDRTRTGLRSPSPELRGLLGYVAKF